MASKRRINRIARHTKCGGKIPYATPQEAQEAVWRTRRGNARNGAVSAMGNELLTPYRCGFCKQYHIGHHH